MAFLLALGLIAGAVMARCANPPETASLAAMPPDPAQPHAAREALRGTRFGIHHADPHEAGVAAAYGECTGQHGNVD